MVRQEILIATSPLDEITLLVVMGNKCNPHRRGG
jgi:hypothetical protein